MEQIRVLLVDDHMVVRQGLRALLETEQDIAVVGEAETGRQAVQLTKKLLPSVVVMDISMPATLELACSGQKNARNDDPDITVVGEAETGRQALQLTLELKPEVVVMDIAMPMLNGLEATRQITKEVPSARVLVLSGYSDGEYVQQLTEAGAAGYLLKQTAAVDLIKAVRETKGRTLESM